MQLELRQKRWEKGDNGDLVRLFGMEFDDEWIIEREDYCPPQASF